MVRAFLGRHYDDQESDTAGIREMRNRLKQVAVEAHRRNPAAEVARASLMGLRSEFEMMLFSRGSQALGTMLFGRESQTSLMVPFPTVRQLQSGIGHIHSPLIMLGSDLSGILSPRPASVASTAVMAGEVSRPVIISQVPAGIQEASGSASLTTVSSFVRVRTGNVAMNSVVSLAAQPQESSQGITAGNIMPPCKAPPTRVSTPQPLVHPTAGITTTRLMPSTVVVEPLYPAIARVPAGAEIADGSRAPAQLLAYPSGMAAFRECVGPARSRTSGIGAELPRDGNHLISGIYVAGLDRHVTELQYIQEFARFGDITKVSFPRDSDGNLSGYGMLEYGHPNMAAAAIYGLHGWEVENRDLEVTVLDRKVIVPRNRMRGGPRASPQILETDD